MSPRAACRLKALGFERVYDYVPGKSDWLARGLPTEGDIAASRIGPLIRDDVITCRLDESLTSVAERLRGSAYGFALVTSPGGTLLGRLRGSVLEAHKGTTVESAMEPGPSTVRPNTDREALRQRLEERGLKTAVATTPEGRLLGVVRRSDLG
jgi:Mg/Co/Ni transporter MgtE